MMKLSTIAVAAALLLSSEGEAYASHEETSPRTRRMRSVNIYSSTPQRNELDKDVDIVDPYMGLPDEREQRDLKRSKPKKKPKPSKESAPDPALEMSMPTAAIAPDVQSLSYSLQGSTSSTEEREQRDLKRSKPKKKPRPSKGSAPDPALEMSMPTAAIAPDVQSFSYSLQGSTTSTEDSAGLTHRRAEERIYNSATMTGHSSVVAAAIVSAFASAAALV